MTNLARLIIAALLLGVGLLPLGWLWAFFWGTAGGAVLAIFLVNVFWPVSPDR